MYILRQDVAVSSLDVWTHVKTVLEGKRAISRASIINFLNYLVNRGVVDYVDVTCRGGFKRTYTSRFDEASFKEWYVELVLGALLRDYPKETWDRLSLIWSNLR